MAWGNDPVHEAAPTGAREAVRVRSLRRSFGETLALNNLDMTVHRGDIYGFLGRNGAGKSTTIRILAGLVRPHGGEADLLGRSALGRDPAVRRGVGFLVEVPSFFPHLDGVENLRCHADLAGGVSLPRIMESLELFGMTDAARRRVGGYSLGMRQRLGLAQAFLNDPEIIVLDEPGISLDPGGMIALREVIRRFAAEKGTTFLISSHILGEMERLCTRVGIIEEGRMAAEGTLSELGAAGTLSIRVSDPAKGASLAGERFPDSAPRELAGGKIQAVLDENEIPELVRLFVDAGLDVFEISHGAATLEELFLDLVERGKES